MSSVSKLCSLTNYPILNIVYKCRFSKSKCIYFEEFVVPSIMCHIVWENGLYEQLKRYAISVISYPWNVQCNGYIMFVRCSDNSRFCGFWLCFLPFAEADTQILAVFSFTGLVVVIFHFALKSCTKYMLQRHKQSFGKL
jgi:hypothetical protein